MAYGKREGRLIEEVQETKWVRALFGKRTIFSKEPPVSNGNLAVGLLETQDRVTKVAKNTHKNFPVL